jgi:serralysin
MLYGTKWGGARGTGVTLTYSFPSGTTWWLSDYGNNDEPDSYYGLDATQIAAARSALAAWATVAAVRFIEVDDNQDTVGEIRFALSNNVDEDSAAHAYMPGDLASAGDVWFSPDYVGKPAAPGSYLYMTMIHETGHALGLNHSFGLAASYDNLFYTVMSYTASPWSSDGDNYASFYPTTPMYFDILALQAIYGKSGLKAHDGNTKYKFGDAVYFEAIFDTGGKDTVAYNGSDYCEIVLKPGSFCIVGQAVEFTTESSRSTVMIGPGTIIENATGNAGDDLLEGNSSKNLLRGRAGADTILGAGGNDTLWGGVGADSLKSGAGRDIFDYRDIAEIDDDIIADFKHKQDRIDLSHIDANLLAAGNGRFAFVAQQGNALHGTAGELRWYQSAGHTLVVGDIDGDGAADFLLDLVGSKALTKGDFIL